MAKMEEVLIPSQTGKHSNDTRLLAAEPRISLNPFSNRETFKQGVDYGFASAPVLIPSQTGKHSNHVTKYTVMLG